MAVDHNNPQSRDEEILIATIDGEEYDKLPQSRIEELLLELKETIEEGGGGGGTTNYNNLSNQPQVNGETLIGDKTGAELGLVDAEEGKGLSTNDYDDTEKAAVAAATSAISAMQDGSEIDSFGDVEVALLDKQDELTAGKYIQITNDEISVKRDIAYEADEVFFAEQTNEGLHVSVTIGSTTLYDENFTTSDPNHTVLDLIQTSFNVRAVRWNITYLKASKTQSAGYETIVWPSVTDTFVTTVDADKKLIIQSEMDAAINSAVSKCYHHAGTKTCAELLPALLIAANEGNVYEMTDSGTTTSDFMEGIGHPIKEGDNVGVARVSEGVYKFDLLSGFVDTSNFVQKSVTAGLLQNDGTVDTTIQGDISSLKSGLTNLDNEVNGDATTYPYADVITIEDAIPANLADCTVKIEPVQDLHGQSAPYVGGAGKNKLPMTVDGIKESSTIGTWSGNAYTHNGVTFTVLTDSDGNVTGINADGTATNGNAALYLSIKPNIEADTTYIMNGCPAGGGDSTYNIQYSNFVDNVFQDNGNGINLTKFDYTTYPSSAIIIRIMNGYNVQNKIFYPMIRLATETDATFAPYTNICPITGHTEASVQRTGKNVLPSTLAIIKAANTNGTWANNVYSYNGVDYTVNTNTSGYVTSIIAANASTTENSSAIYIPMPKDNNKYLFNGGVDTEHNIIVWDAITNARAKKWNGTTASDQSTGANLLEISNVSDHNLTVRCRVSSGVAAGSKTFYPMVCQSFTTDPTFVPYAGKTYTIALGDTIYGGTVDFDSGVMTVDRGYIADASTLGWYLYDNAKNIFAVGVSDKAEGIDNIISSAYGTTTETPVQNMSDCTIRGAANNNIYVRNTQYSDATDFTAAMDGVQLVYELATPTTIQLTPQQIQLLKGQNTLTASTGQISVTVNGVSGSIGQVQEQVNELAEKVAPIPIIRKGAVNFTSLAVDNVFSSDIVFDTPMPNADYTVTATASGTTVALCNVGNRTVNGFTVYVRNIGTAEIGGAVMWQVIG